jgi:hypothetical protein
VNPLKLADFKELVKGKNTVVGRWSLVGGLNSGEEVESSGEMGYSNIHLAWFDWPIGWNTADLPSAFAPPSKQSSQQKSQLKRNRYKSGTRNSEVV